MLEDFTYATFAEQLGSRFRVGLDETKVVELELVEAIELSPSSAVSGDAGAPKSRGESFSLRFLGSRQQFIPQGTYPFGHDEMGDFPMFITPVESTPAGIKYEAVFNRLPG
ncbi:MAG TPA: hypothetical protein VHS06_05525 [Chloroflexota bacterium]|nr:hypothetical protein [Chloroflexota bacterium]